MSRIPLALIKNINVWSCWTGLNASHGIALMLFGLIYGFLAEKHSQLLFSSPFLLIAGLIIISFVALGKIFWFRRFL